MPDIRNEFSADEEQAMRRARAKLSNAASSPFRDEAMATQMGQAEDIADSVRQTSPISPQRTWASDT